MSATRRRLLLLSAGMLPFLILWRFMGAGWAILVALGSWVLALVLVRRQVGTE